MRTWVLVGGGVYAPYALSGALKWPPLAYKDGWQPRAASKGRRRGHAESAGRLSDRGTVMHTEAEGKCWST